MSLLVSNITSIISSLSYPSHYPHPSLNSHFRLRGETRSTKEESPSQIVVVSMENPSLSLSLSFSLYISPVRIIPFHPIHFAWLFIFVPLSAFRPASGGHWSTVVRSFTWYHVVLHHRSRLTRLKSGSQLAERAYYWKMEPQRPYVHRIRETCRQELIRNARTVVNYSNNPPATPAKGFSLSLSLSLSVCLSLLLQRPRHISPARFIPNGTACLSSCPSWSSVARPLRLVALNQPRKRRSVPVPGVQWRVLTVRGWEKGPCQIISPANGAWD